MDTDTGVEHVLIATNTIGRPLRESAVSFVSLAVRHVIGRLIPTDRKGYDPAEPYATLVLDEWSDSVEDEVHP